MGLKALPVTIVKITKIIPELFVFGGLSSKVSSKEVLFFFPCTFFEAFRFKIIVILGCTGDFFFFFFFFFFFAVGLSPLSAAKEFLVSIVHCSGEGECFRLDPGVAWVR